MANLRAHSERLGVAFLRLLQHLVGDLTRGLFLHEEFDQLVLALGIAAEQLTHFLRLRLALAGGLERRAVLIEGSLELFEFPLARLPVGLGERIGLGERRGASRQGEHRAEEQDQQGTGMHVR